MAKNGTGGYQKLDLAPKGARFNSRVETSQQNGQIVNPPRRIGNWGRATSKQPNSLNIERPGREK